MSRETDIAWCAGFFDGEGHVSYHRGYPSKTGNVSPQLYASIAQASTNIEALEFFHSVIGFGKMKGPYPMPNGKPQHRLLYGIKTVEKLFLMLKPYLRKEKTEDFQRALIQFWCHDSTATIEDHARALKKMHKKMHVVD